MSGGKLFAVVVAAGSSSRMGFDKLSACLAGHSVLWHSLRAFQDCGDVEGILLVARESGKWPDGISRAEFSKIEQIVGGGEDRRASVLAGLRAAGRDAGMVAVHDAARPLVLPDTISACYRLALQEGAAVCATPAVDTLHRADASGILTKAIPREGVWKMQTPQIFPHPELLKIYEEEMAAGRTSTDEAGAALVRGLRVAVLPVGEPNFKITHPSDLDLARAVLEGRG